MPLTRTVKNNNRSNCSTLSCTFPCRWFAWLQRETSRKLPGFHFLWRKCGTCSCSLFPLPLIFFSSAIRFESVRCSLGKLDLFENYKGFNIIFPIDWPRRNSTIPPIVRAALSADAVAKLEYSHRVVILPVCGYAERKGQVFFAERAIIVHLRWVLWSKRAGSRSTRYLQISRWQFGAESSIILKFIALPWRRVEMVRF